MSPENIRHALSCSGGYGHGGGRTGGRSLDIRMLAGLVVLQAIRDSLGVGMSGERANERSAIIRDAREFLAGNVARECLRAQGIPVGPCTQTLKGLRGLWGRGT